MKLIPLTKDYQAIIDDEDYEKVSQYKWHIVRGSVCVYAFRCLPGSRQKPGKKENMARLIINVPPGSYPDHINGNGLDNRKGNLRIATHTQNVCNQRKINRNHKFTSKFKGVSENHSKWVARIADRVIGRYPCQFCAALAYDIAAIEMYGQFARLNILSAPDVKE